MSAPALVSRLNDCRSCYKCIRACPTKSISFSEGHAQIIQDECVYCGRCYISCPQDCKIVRDDLLLARRLAREGETYVSLAPSFQAAFPCTSLEVISDGLRKLGFAGVDALYNSDLQLLKALVITSAILFVVMNLLADLAYAWADPRIRLE